MSDALYATRDLGLALIPAEWSSPVLHNGKWYWRCDLVFLSWMNARAAKFADKITPAMQAVIDRVRFEVHAAHNITDDTQHLIPPNADLPEPPPVLGMYDSYALDWFPELPDFAARANRSLKGVGARLTEGEDPGGLRTITHSAPEPHDPERVLVSSYMKAVLEKFGPVDRL